MTSSPLADLPDGYWLPSADGRVSALGDAGFSQWGNALHLNAGVVGMAASPDGGGYWLVSRAGGVFTFGDARFFGSPTAPHLASPVVGMAATPDGGGYWLVSRAGGVFTFGDARFFGSPTAPHLASPVVGMAATPDGGGYWLVSRAGGVFTFGDARFFGSPTAPHLASPVVGMAATPDGGGYWLVSRAGGVFTFGDARFFGSPTAPHLASPVVGMAATPDGGGYWLVSRAGGVFTFGDARFFGSPTAPHLASPVVGIAPGGGLVATATRSEVPGLQIVTQALPTAEVGQPYTFFLVAVGGDAPYHWRVEHGTFPAGLRLDPGLGRISGAPATPAVSDVTVAVSDPRGARSSTILTLLVGSASAPVPKDKGRLAVTIDQLPPGLSGSVTVTGPEGYSAHLTSTRDLTVSPGVYKVSADPVDGSTANYYPTVTGSPAEVTRGRQVVVGVSYLTTVPDTTRVLSAADVADLSPPASPAEPTKLAFSWSGDEPLDLAAVQVGDVLSAPPSPTIPDGLLVKVTSTDQEENSLLVTATRATLTEAVSRFEFQVTGKTTKVSGLQMRRLMARELQPAGKATCLADVTGSINLTNVQFSITPHFDASFSLGSGLQADAFLTVVAGVTYSVSLKAGPACQYTVPLGPQVPLIPSGIPIDLGPVAINITPVFEVDLTGKVEADLAMSFSGQNGFTLQVGASFANGQLSPIDTYTPNDCFGAGCPGGKAPSTSLSGYVKLSLGPKVTFNIGLVPWTPPQPLIGPYVGMDFYGKFQLQQTAPVYQVAIGLEATVGFQISVLGVGLNAQLQIPIVTDTVAAAPPATSSPPDPAGADPVLPRIETGTLAGAYTYQLAAVGYTGTYPGFNSPAGPITFALAGTSTQWGSASCPDDYPENLVSVSNSGLLTISPPGLPLDFPGNDLYIGVTLTDVLGNVTPVCLDAPVIPGVHPASFPLPDAEDNVSYSYQVPITYKNQSGTPPYTCPQFEPEPASNIDQYFA